MRPRFSKRTRWDRRPNKLAEAAASRRASGGRILDLTGSNPTRCGLPVPDRAILDALESEDLLEYAPDPRGREGARRAVSGVYAERGARLDPERLFLTAGTSEGYSHLFRLLADPGDTILVPEPSYPLFEFLAGINDLRIEGYPLVEEEGFAAGVDEVARMAEREAVKAILAVSPGNPTGTYVHDREWEALVEIGRKTGTPLIVDEVFLDYRLDPAVPVPGTRAGEDRVLTFVLDGISKMLALPQMKLGWIAVSGPEGERKEATGRLEVIADTYLSVGAPAQSAVESLLPRREEIQEPVSRRIRSNLKILAEAAGPASAVSLRRPEGGWSAVLRVPSHLSDEAWALRLVEEAGVLVHPGYFYDFPGDGHLVVSLLPEPALFREGVNLMARLVDDVSGSPAV